MGTLTLHSDTANTGMTAKRMSHIQRRGRNTLTLSVQVDHDSDHNYMKLLDDANYFRYEHSPDEPDIFGDIETRLITPRMTFIIVELNYT